MPRRPATFRQSDLKRALRAAKDSGVEVERIEIDPATGKICIIVKGAADADADSALDSWLKNRAYPRTS